MSQSLTDLAWKHDVKLTPKLLLLYMAHIAADDGAGGAHCSPTISALAAAARVTPASVYTALNVLEQRGLIKRESRPAASNLYRLNLSEAPSA